MLVGVLDDLTVKDVETSLANWLLKRCRCGELAGTFDLGQEHRGFAPGGLVAGGY